MALLIPKSLNASSLVEVLVAMLLVIITFTSAALVVSKVSKATATTSSLSARQSVESSLSRWRKQPVFTENSYTDPAGNLMTIKVEELPELKNTYRLIIKATAGSENMWEQTFIEYYGGP